MSTGSQHPWPQDMTLLSHDHLLPLPPGVERDLTSPVQMAPMSVPLDPREYARLPHIAMLTDSVKADLASILSSQTPVLERYYDPNLISILRGIPGLELSIGIHGILFLKIGGELIGYIPNNYCFGTSRIHAFTSDEESLRVIRFVKTDLHGNITDPESLLATAPLGTSDFELVDAVYDSNKRQFSPDESDGIWTPTPEDGGI